MRRRARPPSSLLESLRLPALLARHPERLVRAVFVFVNAFVTIAILAALANATKAPFVFPSLGPTAFLFFATPTVPAASPRNAILGHAIGIACGYAALLAVGLEHAPPATVTGVDGARVVGAALSLATTGAFMMLLNAPHPPAGATTLIVSLGIITRPAYLVLVEAAVALLTLLAIAVNRLAGVPYPLWAAPTSTGQVKDR